MNPDLLKSSRLLRALLCSTSGIACGIAAPPASFAWLVWLAWIPTLYVLRATRPHWKEAALLGWVSGLGIGLVGFSWMQETLIAFGGFPPLLGFVGMLLYAAWMAVPYGAFGVAVAAGPNGRISGWLVGIVFFVTATNAWPLVFPYTPLIGLAQQAEWIQLAELGGVPLVEAHVLTAAWCVTCALTATQRAERIALGLAGLAIPTASFFLGQLRMQQIEASLEAAPVVTVGVVQPNTPPLFRQPRESMERLWSASEQAERAGAEWIVWPEAGPYPYALARPIRGEPESEEARVLARHRVPTLFGAVTYEPDDPLPYNTLIHMGADGRAYGTFEKVRLVPFGEHIPWIDPRWLLERIPTISHINAGAGPARFELELRGGTRVSVGPLICYEDIIADFAHEVAAQPGGLQVFVNATIDAWYGASKEPWEHLALAQFRSVEHRIPLVRSVSTGVSSVVDATGRVVASLPARAAPPGGEPPHEAEVIVHPLALARDTASQPTLFARAGHRLAALCQLASLFCLVGYAVRSRRARVAQPPEHPTHDGELHRDA